MPFAGESINPDEEEVVSMEFGKPKSFKSEDFGGEFNPVLAMIWAGHKYSIPLVSILSLICNSANFRTFKIFGHFCSV